MANKGENVGIAGATGSRGMRTDREVLDRFERLVGDLRRDTAAESNFGRIMGHRAYRAILGLGPQAIPLILRELSGGAWVWIEALESITGENPVPAEHERSSRLMAADWISWGRANGLI